MYGHSYSPEQIQFLRDNIAGRSYADMTAMFNAHFDVQFTLSQIAGALKNRGICNGRSTQFCPGHVPHNKGTKGIHLGGEATQFKSGHKPWNYKPVGSERINAYGYWEVKTADPKTWRPKHIIVWEKTNGPMPKGYAVLFGDGDRNNFDINNLVLVSRRELGVANKFKLLSGDIELTKAGIVIADIYLKIGERKRQSRR